MADTFQLEVATPERLLVSEQVTQAELPAENGYIGILPGHAPLLSALGAGVLSYQGARPQILAIAGGFVEVFDNHVRVLADQAEAAQDIQVDQARRQLEQATEALKQAHDSRASNDALRLMKQAEARIEAAERMSGVERSERNLS